ncbi:MAG: protein-L-isoaspartate(D-aspartate) O-methyltransferase [Halobacteria archaeon]|nr:protein-L-isoaspartate(D-aspartate) O-methyltransferase [Halobacteria archaeon]
MVRNDSESLVERLRRLDYIESDEVARAFRNVPREEFVPENLRDRAYEDRPLRIGEGQTISAPHMVAMITELLNLEKGNKVLEIGTGRGYHAAITAEIVGPKNVYSVERHEKLAQAARDNLSKTGYREVMVVIGDGSKGLPEYGPYDRIYLTCAAPEISETFLSQLTDGGVMVLPIGRGSQTLYRVEKRGDGIKKESHGSVRFVPLVGDEGF